MQRKDIAPLDQFPSSLYRTNKQPIKEDKPKVKIEAPLHDLADLIHNAISGEDQEIDVENTPMKAETYQASIGNQLEQTPQLNVGEVDNEDYEPVNLSSKMQQGQSQSEPSVYDRLNSTLDAAPMRSDYHPSKLRRIGGAIVGGLVGAANGPKAGIETADSIVNQPYRESYQDWLTKSGALEKEAKLELDRGKARSGETQDEIAYFNALRELNKDRNASDPEKQRLLERAKSRGKAEGEEPYKESASDREFNNKLTLEEIARQREQDLEKLRQSGRRELSTEQLKQRDKELKSLETRAQKEINSKENIAKLNRELREKLVKDKIIQNKNQRIPPNQQAYGNMLAENEVAKTISKADELDGLFTPIKDAQGNVSSYRLKSKAEITDSKMLIKWNEKKTQIDNLKKSILKNSFSPIDDGLDIEGDEDTDDILIEELN